MMQMYTGNMGKYHQITLCKMAAKFGFVMLFVLWFLVVGQLCQNHHFYQQYAAAVEKELPTTSCTTIGKTQTNAHCFFHCTMASNILFISSRDSTTGCCACCPLPLSGSVLNGSKWKSFLQISCPSNYKEYKLDDVTICLVYSKSSMNYDDATSYCQTEGGDLIKIDSTDKFNIFKDFLNTTANLTVDVWIQGLEDNEVWRFHDGTPFDDHFCPFTESNRTDEHHIRLIPRYDFSCYDTGANRRCAFVCEISFRSRF